MVCGLEKRKEPTMSTNMPTLLAYTVKNRGKNKKAIWTRIGAALPHNSGPSFSIEIEALPVDGRLVLIPPKSDEEDAAAATE
jgi:hypothetical protein